MFSFGEPRPAAELFPVGRFGRPLLEVPREQPPPFDIVASDGRRCRVMVNSYRDTLGDLAQALALDGDRRLTIDGLEHGLDQPLVDSGIRVGSVVDVADPHRAATSARSPHRSGPGKVEVIAVAGPDCGIGMALSPGRHVVGRAPTADIRIEDPAIDPHHGFFDVGATGVVTFTQLTGRVPVRIDGRPGTAGTEVPPGTSIVLGGTRLIVRVPTSRITADDGLVVAVPSDPWRRIVRRGPRPPRPSEPEPISPPASAETHVNPPATGLVGAAIGVVGAGAVAVLLGQLMFALFALVGAIASIGTWVVGVLSARRRRSRGAKSAALDADRFADEVRSANSRARGSRLRDHTTIEDALRATSSVVDVGARPGHLWARRCDERTGGLRATIGFGRQRWIPPIVSAESDVELDFELTAVLAQASVLDDVPASIGLEPGEVIAFRGAPASIESTARSVVLQLATSYGPADWRLVVVTRSGRSWRWSSWLPHAQNAASDDRLVADSRDVDRLAAVLDAARHGADRPLVLVVDDPSLFTVRTGPLRRFIETARPATIVLVEGGTTPPALCERVLSIGSAGAASWDGTARAIDDAFDICVAGITEWAADAAARRLAPLIDPEDEAVVSAPMSAVLTLADLDDVIGPTAGVGGAAEAVAARWKAADVDAPPRAAIGRSADGLVEIDLVRDGPHGLIAGTTGSGKSELLRTLVAGLAVRLSPDQLTFVLVDYKGGSTFDACADLPHTVGVVTDLDAGLAERALVSLEAELRRREHLLREVGAGDLAEYRDRARTEVIPRLLVVIDEFAALAKELPDFLASLVGIAQRGRSLGVHLLLATQRPAGVVNDDIRSNTNLRVALRLNDSADANDVVADDQPVSFPRGVPGRAALRLGPDELVVFQSARCTGPMATDCGRLRVEVEADVERSVDGPAPGHVVDVPSELDAAVAIVTGAAEIAGIATPHRPWLAPLPDRLSQRCVDDVAGAQPHDAIGLVDDPAAQSQTPLRWEHHAGNLALVGALGSGTSSTLVALVAARCRMVGPDRLHVFVVDARGDHSLDGLAGVAHCGAIVRASESERLHRLFARLDADIDRRAAGTGSIDPPDVIVVVDGLVSMRNSLGSIDRASTLALVDRVLADGPAVGVVACWSADDSLTAIAVADTWRFSGGGPATSTAGHGPDAVPGRIRIESSGLDAQVVVGAAGLASLPSRSGGGGPSPVSVLPQVVHADALRIGRAATSRSAGATELAVGLDSDELEVAHLRVPVGDHVFVGGAASTGKTTTLLRLTAAWREVHPDGLVVAVDRRCPPVLELDDTTDPVLIVVDDAERVDDADGGLARVVAAGRPGLIVLAAARLDAVRASYGHWTRDVARSRCGLIMTSLGDVDGDLLGATLPRRSLIPARPGLAWLIDGAGCRQVQVAVEGQADAGGESPSNQRGPAPIVPAESSGL